jgi:FkbM family methyltransferase
MRVPIFIKRFIAGFLCHRIVGRIVARAYQDRIPWNGFTINVRGDIVRPQEKASLYFGMYESAEYRFCRKYVQSGWNILELGAGIGVITCLLRALIGRQGWLRTVEANPLCVDTIAENLKQNHGADDETDIIWGALDYSSPHSVEVKLALGASHTHSRIDSAEGTVLVPRLALNELLRGSPSNGTLCLVADIEGAEAGFILLDSETLGKFGWLIMELHETKFQDRLLTAEDLLFHCESIGFQLIDRYGNVVVMTNAVSPGSEAVL